MLINTSQKHRLWPMLAKKSAQRQCAIDGLEATVKQKMSGVRVKPLTPSQCCTDSAQHRTMTAS